jgi:methionyl-tRNA synthetase
VLFSLGLDLPKTIFAHGWWLTGDTKMSKSLGNVINPMDFIEKYGVDAVRYFLMREMVLGADANFTEDAFIKRYNSDLANDFGNLLNRVSGLLGKNHGGLVPTPGAMTPAEEEIVLFGRGLSVNVHGLVAALKIHEAIDETLNLVRLVNKYLESQAPWKLAKTDLPSASRVLYVAAEALRLSAALLKPVMPSKTQTVLDILGAGNSGLTWGELKSGTKLQTHEALFPRIEVEKK